MKKILLTAIIITALLLTPATTFAQGMPVPSAVEGMETQSDVPSDDHTAREEAEGKEVWEKLQEKEVTCETLKDGDFGALGEYFMGQMVGDSHESMNTMMERMMGKEGEEQMHVVMGRRLSGCDSNAQIPQSGVGFMPMMWMMGSAFVPWSFGGTKGGGNSAPALSGAEGMGYGGWNNMMGSWNGIGLLGWLPMLLFWILLVLGVVALIRYLGGSGKRESTDKSSLEILKRRYAKGEIDKKEFEQMKKDLS